MTGRFPYTTLAKYPHMKPEDVAVWQRFVVNNPAFFDSVDYDVPCGIGATPNPDHPINIQRDHIILTQKKVDVVGYNGNIVTLVEVKPIADMRSMGQIIAYHHLFTKCHPEHTIVNKMIVCGSIERELDEIFTENNIITEVA